MEARPGVDATGGLALVFERLKAYLEHRIYLIILADRY
jgi:hypothetical protein